MIEAEVEAIPLLVGDRDLLEASSDCANAVEAAAVTAKSAVRDDRM